MDYSKIYAGPQSIFGFQVCGDTVATVGLSGSIGADCPTGAMEWFKRYNVVIEGLLETNHDTPRAWQLFEADGLRTQVCSFLFRLGADA